MGHRTQGMELELTGIKKRASYTNNRSTINSFLSIVGSKLAAIVFLVLVSTFGVQWPLQAHTYQACGQAHGNTT